MTMSRLSILIPAYNEAHTIARLLDKVIEAPITPGITKEIMVINDGSTDDTQKILDKYSKRFNQQVKHSTNTTQLVVFHKKKNEGKGAAIHTGIKMATGNYIIIQDGDLELEPSEINLLLQPLINGFADVVYGSRFIGDKPHNAVNLWHSAGNRFLTFMSNKFSGIHLTDMETCYKLFKADILKSIPLKEKRFGFEPEVTAKIAKMKGIKIQEVGISYYGRKRSDNKKIGWKDALRTMWCIVKYNIF